MILWTFRLAGWLKSYANYQGGPDYRPPSDREVTALAETEKEARLLANPHAKRWAQALRRARRYKDRRPIESMWYEEVAKHHEEAAKNFNRAAVLIAKEPVEKP